MICPTCKRSELKQKVVAYSEGDVYFGDFEAKVCEECGEQIFDSKTVRLIQKRSMELGLFGRDKDSTGDRRRQIIN